MTHSYLEDKEFLKRLDLEQRKVQYVKLTLLDFRSETPIAYLEGIATGGTVNLNGTSNIRRTMSCSLLVIPDGISRQASTETIKYGNITEIENLISLNKKIRAEVGFKNTLAWDVDCYPDQDIIWFPLGTFIIKTASVSKNNSGTNLSLTLHDKTVMLNGDVGGTIPAATVFSENEMYIGDEVERVVEKVLYKDIIRHLVVDFGGEDPSRVIIEDIPDSIRKVMKWTGTEILYFDKTNKLYTTTKPESGEYLAFEYGEDCGYMLEPFCYPGTLECAVGESVSSVLDKIRNSLGNYEWFYDVWGNFHFQEKKNYLNTSQAISVLNTEEKTYFPVMNLSKSVYTFDESNRKLLTSISSSPQYQNIKNDFVVWGSKKTASGASKPVRYHLAFDTKPEPKVSPRLCIVYTDYRNLQQAIVLNSDNHVFGAAPEKTDKPFTPEQKSKYYLQRPTENANKYRITAWDEENGIFRVMPKWELYYLYSSDWRSELYFLGLESVNKTFAKNYYAAELSAEFPKIYNIKKTPVKEEDYIPTYSGGYLDNVDPSDYEYFLDFIDGREGGSTNLAQYNIENIGRRTKVGKDNGANCVFQKTSVPNIIIIPADGDTFADYNKPEDGYEVSQVDIAILSHLVLGGGSVSAYDKVKELLIQHTSYNEAVTLNTIPIYYLEPNTLIKIDDAEIGVSGYYLINTISLPLTLGTSSISCIKSLQNTI